MQTFQLLGQQLSILECFGFITGVTGVWLTIKQNILCFPVGIINVAIYAIIFFDPKSTLYLNALLQLVYAIVLIYGWINWKKATDKLTVTHTEKRSGLILLFIGVISSIACGYAMKEHTDARLPYWDAVTAFISLIAQWLVAKKKIENWLLWIVADVMYVGMNIYLSYYLTALLYFIYFILAIKGYLEWKKAMMQTSNALH
jgi:nicotinamide mononucleotide transporter